MDLNYILEIIGMADNQRDYLELMLDVEGSEAVRLADLINNQLLNDFESRPGIGVILDSLARLRSEMDNIVILAGPAYEIDREYMELAMIYT